MDPMGIDVFQKCRLDSQLMVFLQVLFPQLAAVWCCDSKASMYHGIGEGDIGKKLRKLKRVV